MLWFLGLAAKQGYIVDAYRDEPEGIMDKNADGEIAMTRVTLRPCASFNAGGEPNDEQCAALHHEAHKACFLANSVRTQIVCKSTKAAGTSG